MTIVLAIVVAVITGLAGSVAAQLPRLRRLRVQHLRVNDAILGVEAAPGVEARPSLVARMAAVEDRVESIRAEVTPNGGDTGRLGDRIVRIERDLAHHMAEDTTVLGELRDIAAKASEEATLAHAAVETVAITLEDLRLIVSPEPGTK